ncbi:MAG: TldD/PmbA family protein [Candidatus Spechtbacteria bacterium]|nr:TldD/PmbA family protein [Candidatus Spechtbacteria bacterium]
MDMEKAKKLAHKILDSAAMIRGIKKGGYVDVRCMYVAQEAIAMNSTLVEYPNCMRESGVGIRVLLNGCWGFASFPDLNQPMAVLESKAEKALKEAIELARVAKRVSQGRITLAPLLHGAEVSRWETPCQVNPSSVALSEKIQVLERANESMLNASSYLSVVYSKLNFRGVDKLFASYENGAYRFIFQHFLTGGISLYVYASDGNDVQQRSYGCFGKNIGGGFESIAALDIETAARSIAEEAEELLFADECPNEELDVILLPDQCCLHVHETGHGLEGDRNFGYEETYIGGTYVEEALPEIGMHRFGSESVNLVADATMSGGYGTFGFDDEGVPAQKFFLVEKGILKNVLTSRETIAQLNNVLGREYFSGSNGTMRAYSSSRAPLIRMTNICLLPGTKSLEDLIADVEQGIILTGSYSWSMSKDRRNFDFGLERGILIKNGKRQKVVKNPGYRGDNIAFWHSLEEVAGESEFEISNIPNCGKGHPAQYRPLGHGSPPALFRNVQIYNRMPDFALGVRNGRKRRGV